MTEAAPPSPRRVFLLVNTHREQSRLVARRFLDALTEDGIVVRVLDEDARELPLPDRYAACGTVEVVPCTSEATAGCEIVVVVGGDGTILRAAELAREAGTPVMGVNLGHVGFLAEAEPDDVEHAIAAVLARDYQSEERLTVDVEVFHNGERIASTWALNEASVEKAARQRMVELVVEVDGRPLSRWGCDGVVFSTPTGSTAYSFSAGGPVVWPEVKALLIVPISAHALFARPMVVSPHSVAAVEVIAETAGSGVLWCDGRRTVDLPPGARVEVRRGHAPVRLARLHRAPFTDRLVAKFELPVQGWRGSAAARRRKREHGA